MQVLDEKSLYTVTTTMTEKANIIDVQDIISIKQAPCEPGCVSTCRSVLICRKVGTDIALSVCSVAKTETDGTSR